MSQRLWELLMRVSEILLGRQTEFCFLTAFPVLVYCNDHTKWVWIYKSSQSREEGQNQQLLIPLCLTHRLVTLPVGWSTGWENLQSSWNAAPSAETSVCQRFGLASLSVWNGSMQNWQGADLKRGFLLSLESDSWVQEQVCWRSGIQTCWKRNWEMSSPVLRLYWGWDDQWMGVLTLSTAELRILNISRSCSKPQ